MTPPKFSMDSPEHVAPSPKVNMDSAEQGPGSHIQKEKTTGLTIVIDLWDMYTTT